MQARPQPAHRLAHVMIRNHCANSNIFLPVPHSQKPRFSDAAALLRQIFSKRTQCKESFQKQRVRIIDGAHHPGAGLSACFENPFPQERLAGTETFLTPDARTRP